MFYSTVHFRTLHLSSFVHCYLRKVRCYFQKSLFKLFSSYQCYSTLSTSVVIKDLGHFRWKIRQSMNKHSDCICVNLSNTLRWWLVLRASIKYLHVSNLNRGEKSRSKLYVSFTKSGANAQVIYKKLDNEKMRHTITKPWSVTSKINPNYQIF